MRHSFIFPVMEYNSAILYFHFPLQEKLCRNNAKYIFGVCFTLLRHTFFILKKFFKKLLKKISLLSISDTPIWYNATKRNLLGGDFMGKNTLKSKGKNYILLNLYDAFLQGRAVVTKEWCKKFNISRITFCRYIEFIRRYFNESYGIVIIYSYKDFSYKISNNDHNTQDNCGQDVI